MVVCVCVYITISHKPICRHMEAHACVSSPHPAHSGARSSSRNGAGTAFGTPGKITIGIRLALHLENIFDGKVQEKRMTV